MKKIIICCMLAVLAVGCSSGGPVISKSQVGNLEINVYSTEERTIRQAELYLDGTFIGNVTDSMPVIHARRGERMVRIEAAGYKTYEKKITILGEPNHQVLNVFLEKE